MKPLLKIVAIIALGLTTPTADAQDVVVDIKKRSLKVLGEEYRRNGSNNARLGSFGYMSRVRPGPWVTFKPLRKPKSKFDVDIISASLSERQVSDIATRLGLKIDPAILKQTPIDALGGEGGINAPGSDEYEIGLVIISADPASIVEEISALYEKALSNGDERTVEMIEDPLFRFVTAEVQISAYSGQFAKLASGNAGLEASVDGLGEGEASITGSGARKSKIEIGKGAPIAFTMNMLCWKRGRIVEPREHQLRAFRNGRPATCKRKVF